ncbi:hypothetical protein FACS1894190_07190 [Spirochaetia bacterium]|nr:hypothetical protein FACS1894190_07190 [Spirochaetia bacterium]
MKPILFSTQMVQALLNTKPNTYPPEPIDASKPCKGMTRRVIKYDLNDYADEGYGAELYVSHTEGGYVTHKTFKPKYQVGDVLWVRETYRCTGFDIDEKTACIQYKDEKSNRVKFSDDERFKKYAKCYAGWKPLIHMPREAARIFLKVRDVRIERLQDISEQEANDEGAVCIKCKNNTPDCKKCPFEHCFKKLWDSLDARRGYCWDTNPYVWVYGFEGVNNVQ